MTINLSDNTPRVSYTVAQGVTQTSFTVSFEFFAEADLNVYVDGTLKTLTTDYSVSGGSGATGSITMSVTGATGGSTVVITRDIALERTTDFPAAGAFQIASLNTELDKITAQFADRKDDVDRSLRLKDQDAAVSMELPLKAARLGTVLGFNASTGAPEAGPTIANVNSLADITTNINTVAGISSNVTTVAGISANVTTVAGISSNVSTVAGISSNVTSVAGNATNINTVATNISNINSVAAKSSLITSDFVSDLNTLAVTDVINDINTLATSDIVSDLNTLATSDIVSDLNTLATSDIVSDINTLATSDIVTDLNLLATSDFVADLNTIATTTNVNNLATVAGAVSNVNTVAGISSDVTAVAGISSDVAAVEDIAANVTSVAGNASNINAAVSNASNINAVVSNASNINSVAGIAANVTTVAGIASNVTTVAGAASNVSTVAGAITNVNNVGGSIANVNTVATNISGVNSFAERYRVGSSDPSSSLDAGDLAYNTSDNALKYYTGSAWASITAGIGNVVEDSSPQLGGDLQSNGNDIDFADNDKAVFGSNSDFSLHHNSTTGENLLSLTAGPLEMHQAGTNSVLQVHNDGTNHNQLVEFYKGNSAHGNIRTDTGKLIIDAEGELSLQAGGGIEIVTINNTGDVTVKGQGSNRAMMLLKAGSNTANSQIRFGDQAADSAGRIYYDHSNNFMRFDTNEAERMRLDSSGNLLVGGTSLGENGAVTMGGDGRIYAIRASDTACFFGRTGADGSIVKFTKDGSTAGSIGTFDSGANIYIGSGDTGVTFNPTVNGILPHNPSTNAQLDNAIDLGYPTYRFKHGYFANTVYTASVAGITDNDTYINFANNNIMQFITGGSERARFTSGGNFRINQSSIDSPGLGNTTTGICIRSDNIVAISSASGYVSVNRNSDGLVQQFNRSGSTVGTINITSSGTTYNTTSDIRLKQDIEPLVATDKLMQMNPVSYSWKADPDGPRSMGFIAQEMQKVMPEAVSTGDDDDAMMSMDYGRITPILVSALQDAHKKIEELENRIAAMESK